MIDKTKLESVLKSVNAAANKMAFERAVAELIEVIGNYVYSRVRKALGVQECEDAVQELFLKLITILTEREIEIKNFEHYLNRMITNRITDAYRKLGSAQQRQVSETMEIDGEEVSRIDYARASDKSSASEPESLLARRAARDLNQALVNELSRQQRITYVLWSAGESLKTIAEQLGLSLEGAKTNIQAAKHNLRRLFCERSLDTLKGHEQTAVSILIKHTKYKLAIKEAGQEGMTPDEFEGFWKTGMNRILQASDFAVLVD